MSAAKFIALVEALKAPYGLERSIKIAHGHIADDRCLISLGRADLGDACIDRLADVGRTLQMPRSFVEALPASLDGADIVHFGYETAAGQEIHKIYFEYAAAARRAMAEPSPEPALVHLAYKWVVSRPESAAITRYTWLPARSARELETKLRELVPESEAPRALRCMLGLLARIRAFADADAHLLMKVEEQGNPRRSCDLNVYGSGLRVRDISNLLETTMADFAVRERVFELHMERTLGHVSAGLGRDAQEFVTIYFGVEGRRPA